MTASTDGTARIWDARPESSGHRPHRSWGQGLATRLQPRWAVDRDREQGWNGAHLGRGNRPRQLLVLRHPHRVSRVAFTPRPHAVTRSRRRLGPDRRRSTGELRHVLPGGGGTVLALAVDSRGASPGAGTRGACPDLGRPTGRRVTRSAAIPALSPRSHSPPSDSLLARGRGRRGPPLEHGDRRPRVELARSCGHRSPRSRRAPTADPSPPRRATASRGRGSPGQAAARLPRPRRWLTSVSLNWTAGGSSRAVGTGLRGCGT